MENEYVEVRESGIHSKGVFAKKLIPKGTKLLEYIGRKVDEEEANRIYEEQLEIHKKDPTKGGVYIFELDDEYSIDGDVPDNIAKYTNHSCNPNCWIDIIDNRIWIIASRDIQPDEEITYDYGYDMDDDWEDHKCCCGQEGCTGYIVDEEHRPKIRKILEKRKQ